MPRTPLRDFVFALKEYGFEGSLREHIEGNNILIFYEIDKPFHICLYWYKKERKYILSFADANVRSSDMIFDTAVSAAAFCNIILSKFIEPIINCIYKYYFRIKNDTRHQRFYRKMDKWALVSLNTLDNDLITKIKNIVLDSGIFSITADKFNDKIIELKRELIKICTRDMMLDLECMTDSGTDSDDLI